MEKIEVYYEATPNPQTMKFYTGQAISDESMQIDSIEQARRSPLAQKLFGFPWMAGVFIGPNFVSITKQDWVEWNILADPLCDLISEHLSEGEPVVIPPDSMEEDDSDSDTVKTIKKILNEEIRPAVAMDGGDIVFSKYEGNRLYLHMQGACSGCPSAEITLKEGIEKRIKEYLPEVQEVISI